MLWLAVHLPHFAAEVVGRGNTVREPFAVVAGAGARQVVVEASACAARAGIAPGMRSTAALAMLPGLCLAQRDGQAEEEALARLACWAGRFTPFVSLAPPRALLLEVEGSLRLFGGMETLARSVEEGIRGLGYTPRLASAPAPLGALLLARSRPGARAANLRELRAALGEVPLAALDLPPEVTERLEALGVRSLGDCAGLPRGGLARRFGGELLRYLDRAFGLVPDPRARFAPPPRFEGRLALFAETESVEAVLFAANRLCMELGGYLEGLGCGVTAARLALFHGASGRTVVDVDLFAPARDPSRLLGLFRERLGGMRFPAPVSAVALSAERLVPFPCGAPGLWEGPGNGEPGGWAALVERLEARLGRGAVRGIAPAAEHRPERAFSLAPPGGGRELEDVPRRGVRPLWLLPRPVPLDREVTLLLGPERIESGWWDGEDVRRDYFTAEDGRGARLWVFRDLDGEGRWYLHGIFA